MHFVDKIFPRWEKKNFFTISGAVLVTALVLLLPAILKFMLPGPRHASPSGGSEPIWGRFIFAHVLFLVQAFFYFLHPACRFFTKEGRIAVGFFLLFLFGCLMSPWLTGNYRSFQEMIKLFSASSLFFLFLYFSYKGSSGKILRTCAFLGCFLMTGEALLGLGQYALQSDLGLQWLGEKQLQPTWPCATIRFPDGARFIFDSSAAAEILRPYGTFDHPNHFGGLLVVGVILTCYLLLRHAQTRISKTLLTAALTLQGMALVATYSRSAWLGGAIGAAVLLGCRYKDLWRNGRTLLAAIGISAIFTFFIFHHQIIERCSRGSSSVAVPIEHPLQYLQELDLGKRGHFLGIAQEMIVNHPWKGVGFQEFARQIPVSCSEKLPVHNIYMLAAAELGLPAAIAFIAFVILVLWQAFRNSSEEALPAIWLMIAVIGFMDNYFLTSQIGRFLFFAAAALIIINYSSQSVKEKE